MRWSVDSAHYVYAIVHRDSALTAITAGIAGDLAMVSCRELAAVTRYVHNDVGVPATMKAVLQHEVIVEALRNHYPALPVRFGTVFRNAESITSAIAEQYELLVADLDRVGDKVELSVTALWAVPACGDERISHTDDAPSQHAGARYLRARAFDLRRDEAQKERAGAAARKLDDALRTFTLECRTSLLPTPRIAVRTAYLLHPAKVGAFRAAFDALRGVHDDLRLLLTGPWPPYNFVRRTDPEDAGAHHRLGEFARLLTDAMGERRG